MSDTPIVIVRKVLENPTDPDAVNELVAADAVYINLNYENKELQRILPWTGTTKGPQAFIDTFHRFFKYWDTESYEIKEVFGIGENVAVFGAFTYRSMALGKTVSSPFSVLAKVKGGKIVYFQYLEDTYATAESVKAGGTWRIHIDPEGKPFEV